MKLDANEKDLLDFVEGGEWKSAGGGKRERTRYTCYAKATFRKDRRLNIRLSSKDLEAIQKRALAEGLPYQTLIASLLHKYAAGRLKGDLTNGLPDDQSEGPSPRVQRLAAPGVLEDRGEIDDGRSAVAHRATTWRFCPNAEGYTIVVRPRNHRTLSQEGQRANPAVNCFIAECRSRTGRRR